MNTSLMPDLKLLLSAADFAAEKHRNQRRKDIEASPYINHPLRLAKLLAANGGITDTNVLAAALLHDTIEDTETTSEELAACFGPSIASIVEEVTDDKSLAKAERKQRQIEHAPSLSPGARLVKLADKVANLTDVLNSPAPDWSFERRLEYFEWAKRVVDQLRGCSKPLEALFDELYQRRHEVTKGAPA